MIFDILNWIWDNIVLLGIVYLLLATLVAIVIGKSIALADRR